MADGSPSPIMVGIAGLALGAIMLVVEPTLANDRAITCLFGRSEETLRTWALRTGQLPLLGFDTKIGEDVVPAWLMANTDDGSVTILYRDVSGLTCVGIVGKDARATPKLPALEIAPNPGGPEL